MSNNETTNTTINLRQCGHIKLDGSQCTRKFRSQDDATRCFQHRVALMEPVSQERALSLPIRKLDELTFRVNVGEALLGGRHEGKLYAFIAGAISQRLGIDMKMDAFLTATIGTRDSAVTMPSDAGQFVLMAFPSEDAYLTIEIIGRSYRFRIALASEEWTPTNIEEKCGACFAAGRVCVLDDKNRWVVKVAVLAKENGLKHAEVSDEDLRATSVCPFHGKAANRLATEAAHRAGTLKESNVYVYNPYNGLHGEGPYLRGLQERRDTLDRAKDEFAAVFTDENGAFKLGEVAAGLAADRKKKGGNRGRY